MIVLGKNKFVVPRPGHMRTFALQQRLFPIAGSLASVFVTLIGQTDLSKIMEKDILETLPAALPRLGEIFSSMPPGEIEFLTRTLLGDPKTGAAPLEVATVDGAALFAAGKDGDAFDLVLQGRTMDTWKLLAHAMEVYYPDFFALVRPLVEHVRRGKDSVASSTSPTLGPSSA